MNSENKPKKHWLPWVIVLSVFVLLIGLNIVNQWHIVLRVPTEKEIALEYGTPYDVPKGEAVLCGNLFATEGFPIQVQKNGSVNSNKVGQYTLHYWATFLWFQAEETRTVRIVDTTPPVLTLVPDEADYFLPGTVYPEAGFRATDNVDGDITSWVEREDMGDVIRYRVADSAGNTAEAERKLVFDDPVAPELTLLGQTEIEQFAGTEYVEPGFTAVDNLDGDITDRVTVTGEVKRFIPGTYELTYEVEDSYHNHTSVTRTVTVKKVEQPSQLPPGSKVIYLTFDDGPSKYTEKLLQVLDKYGIQATFFVVNYGYSDMIAKEAAAGHTVAVHSLTHDYNKIYASEEAFFADIQAMNEIVKEQTGSYTTMIRFPGGSSNTVSSFNPGIMTRLTQAVTDAGYQYYDWNVSSGDAGLTTDTDVVFQNVIDGVRGHDVSIVLQHDSKGYSVDAVERIILWGLENGYTFLPLTPESPKSHHRLNN